MWKFAPYLVVFATICLAIFTIREFSRGDLVWAALGALGTIALATTLFLPVPTHAVVKDATDSDQ